MLCVLPQRDDNYRLVVGGNATTGGSTFAGAVIAGE